jgi:hypothetical protein
MLKRRHLSLSLLAPQDMFSSQTLFVLGSSSLNKMTPLQACIWRDVSACNKNQQAETSNVVIQSVDQTCLRIFLSVRPIFDNLCWSQIAFLSPAQHPGRPGKPAQLRDRRRLWQIYHLISRSRGGLDCGLSNISLIIAWFPTVSEGPSNR